MWEILLSVSITLEKHGQINPRAPMLPASEQCSTMCFAQGQQLNVHSEILAPLLIRIGPKITSLWALNSM